MSTKVNLVSDEEKLRVVKLYLNGGISQQDLSDQVRIPASSIRNLSEPFAVTKPAYYQGIKASYKEIAEDNFVIEKRDRVSCPSVSCPSVSLGAYPKP